MFLCAGCESQPSELEGAAGGFFGSQAWLLPRADQSQKRGLVVAGAASVVAAGVAQLGAVSDVSSDSVTVKSSDGFTRTYTLGDAQR